MDRVSLLSLLVGSVLPLLVATVTKSSWSEALKSLLLALLSAGMGVGAAYLHPTDRQTTQTVVDNALATFLAGCAAAAQVWRPTGAIGRLESMFVRDAEPVLRESGILGAASSGALTHASVIPPSSSSSGTASGPTTRS